MGLQFCSLLPCQKAAFYGKLERLLIDPHVVVGCMNLTWSLGCVQTISTFCWDSACVVCVCIAFCCCALAAGLPSSQGVTNPLAEGSPSAGLPCHLPPVWQLFTVNRCTLKCSLNVPQSFCVPPRSVPVCWRRQYMCMFHRYKYPTE